MKKLILFFAVFLSLFSCSDNNEELNMRVLEFNVRSSDWIENLDNNGINRYYSYTFNVPQMVSYIVNNGSVVTYIKVNGAQQILPYVRHYQNIDDFYWTRTVDFDYSTNKITYYVTSSDFFKEQPETMSFRVVLTW